MENQKTETKQKSENHSDVYIFYHIWEAAQLGCLVDWIIDSEQVTDTDNQPHFSLAFAASTLSMPLVKLSTQMC